MKSLNGILIVSALVMAFALYKVKYDALDAARQIDRMNAEIAREEDSIRVLRAEWSHLVQPERIDSLSRKHLGLDILTAEQIVRLAELPEGTNEPDPYANQPTIGDLMQELRIMGEDQ